MERTVSLSILTVVVVFTALVTTLIWLAITCITVRMRRFDILYQIEQDQTHAKIRDLDSEDVQFNAKARTAKAVGYTDVDIETLAMAPHYNIDLKGNLEKKVKADQEEAEKKRNNRKSWFGGRNAPTLAAAAPPMPKMNEEERIRQQLEAVRRVQDEQLEASYARFNSALASGNRTGGSFAGDLQHADSTGEMRSQFAEFEFRKMHGGPNDMLPLPARSPRACPSPSTSALNSPNNPNSRMPQHFSGTSHSRTSSLTLATTMGTDRRIESPRPFQGEYPGRPRTSNTLRREAGSPRPGTSGTMGSMMSGERRYMESPPPQMNWSRGGDDRYNPHNMI